MGKVIGAKIVLEGESEFRAAVTSSNKAIATMKSELGLVTAQYQKNANSLEALRSKQEVYVRLQDEQKKKITSLNQAQQNAVKRYEEESKKLEELKKKRDEDNKKLQEAKKIYGEGSKEVEKLTEELDKSTKEYDTQEKALSNLNNKIENYSKQINDANKELIELNNDEEKNSKCLLEAEKSTDKTAKSIDEYGNEVQKASKNTASFATIATAAFTSQVIYNGIRVITREVKQISVAAINTGKEFETAMSTVAATMNISAADIKNHANDYKILEDAAREAGKTTKFSAKEASDAENYLALAGYNATKAAQALPDVLTLAAAGAMDLAYASDLVTDSMSALGISTDQLTNFTDQMATTSQKSNTNIAQLGEAILTIGGTAKQLVGGTVELNTELGILADNGIKGAEGGTALRNILKNLTAPTDKAADCLEKYNIRVYDLQGNMRPLNEVFKDLGESLDGLSDQERAQVMNQIFDARNLKSAEAMIANCGDRFDELSSYIANCDGAAKNMAETMSNNLEGKSKQFGNTLKDLGITIYSKFENPLKNAVTSATDGVLELEEQMDGGHLGRSIDNLATSFSELSGSMIELGIDALPTVIDAASWMIDNGNVIITLITGITAAKVTYTAATKAATIAQQAFNVTANLNPYVMLATVTLGAAAAFVTYEATTKKARNATQLVANEINTCTENVQGTIQAAKGLEGDLATKSGYINSLKNELIRLNEAQSDDENKKKRLKEIVSILNEELPDLNLLINDQTGYINMSSDSISKNIDNLMAWSKAQAMQEKAIEVAKKQQEADFALYEGKKKILEVNEEIQEIERKQENFRTSGDDYADQQNYAVLVDQRNALIQSKQELTDAITQQKEAAKSAGEEMEYIEGYIQKEKSSMDESTLSAYENANAQKELGDTALETAGEIGEAGEQVSEAYQEMYDKLFETISGQLSLFEEFQKGDEVSKSQLLKNMQSQIDGLEEWGNDLERLATRTDVAINQGLIKYLADMGPQGANYVKAFADMTTEQLEDAVDKFNEASTLPYDVTQQAMYSYEEAGKNYMESAQKGMQSQEEAVKNQAEKTAKKSTEGLVEGQKKGQAAVEKQSKETAETITKSTSKALTISGNASAETKKQGEAAAEGLAKGQENKTKAVQSQAEKTANTVVTETKKVLSKNVFVGIGEKIDANLAEGIKNGKSVVVKAMKDVAKSIIEAANAEVKTKEDNGKKTLSQNGVSSNNVSSVQGFSGSADSVSENISNSVNDLNFNVNNTVDKRTYLDSTSIQQLAGAIRSEVSNQLSTMQVVINSNADINKMFDLTVELNRDYAKMHGGSAYDV